MPSGRNGVYPEVAQFERLPGECKNLRLRGTRDFLNLSVGK